MRPPTTPGVGMGDDTSQRRPKRARRGAAEEAVPDPGDTLRSGDQDIPPGRVLFMPPGWGGADVGAGGDFVHSIDGDTQCEC